MSIDAGANGGAAESKLTQGITGMANIVNGFANRDAISRELLPKADRDGVLHVRAARLHYVMKFLAFGFKGGGQRVERGVKFFQLQQRRHAHRGWKNVVCRLPVINVVI